MAAAIMAFMSGMPPPPMPTIRPPMAPDIILRTIWAEVTATTADSPREAGPPTSQSRSESALGDRFRTQTRRCFVTIDDLCLKPITGLSRILDYLVTLAGKREDRLAKVTLWFSDVLRVWT